MTGEKKEVLNKLVKGAGLTAVGMFASKALAYLYRILVGRYLGPEAYGQLSIGMMIFGIAMTVSSLGVGNGLQKFIPEYRTEDDKAAIKGALISCLQMNFISTIILGSAIFFSSEFIAIQIFESPDLVPVIRIFGLLPIIARPYRLFLDTSIGFNDAKLKVGVEQILQNILQIIATAGFLLIGYELIGAIMGWVVASIISALVALYLLEKKIGPILTSKVKTKYQHRKLFQYSYPLLFTGLIGSILGWTDTGFLGYYMDDTTVGLYNAAFPTALLILIPHQAFGTLALSSLSELGNKKEEGLSSALKTITNWSFALVFPAFLIMALFSEQIIQILFGKQYLAAAPALTILAFGNLSGAIFGRVGSLMKSKGRTKILLYNSSLVLLINVLLNLLLIPKLGITGAAIATATSTILSNTIIFLLVCKYENIISLDRNMLRTFIAGTTSLVIVYLLINNLFRNTPLWALIPSGIIFFLSHFLLFFKIGGLKEHDKQIILTLARKFGYEEKTRKIMEILT